MSFCFQVFIGARVGQTDIGQQKDGYVTWQIRKTALRRTRNILDCDQSNVLLARIISPVFFKLLFSSFLFTPQMTSSVTWPFDSRGSTFYGWSIVTMRLSSTVMEIWPFEVLPGRLFQEQRSVVGRSVGRSSIFHWSYILLFATLGT